MSVIVKGMKLPESCFTCLLKEYGWCNKWVTSVDCAFERHSACPLVEVPTPHGRLVDLDAMIDEFWDGDYMEIHCKDLDSIPVIIEAGDDHE